MTLTVRPAPTEWKRGRITVAGVVPQQGSKTYGTTKDGKAYGRENKGAELKAFRADVATAVARDYPGLTTLEPIFPKGEPVALRLLLLMPLTKAQAAKWTEHGPTVWHTVTPDADKQTRAVLDALKLAHLYADDAQVCYLEVRAIRHRHVGAVIEWSAL